MADHRSEDDPAGGADAIDATAATDPDAPIAATTVGDAGADPRPAERLRARAAATDRESRFELRLTEVKRMQARRRRVRRYVRLAWVVVLAGVGALAPLVLAAVLAGPDPGGGQLLVGAGVGAVLGAVGPSLRNWVARRRGASAWDAYNERYVLLGDPSVEVRDADRPETRDRSSLPPGRG